MAAIQTRSMTNSAVFATGTILLGLTIAVAIPMTVVTIQSHGGEWGFEMIGLTVLVPLCGYALFGLAGLLRKHYVRRKVFIASHIVSLILGIVYCFVFPIYPVFIVIVPILFAGLGIVDKRNLDYYLVLMQVLGIASNIFLLVGELNDGRTVPVLQLVGL
jgi:hypothetical protein